MGTSIERSFALTHSWNADHVAVGVIGHDGATVVHGAIEHRFRLASVSKLMTAWATLIAIEDGSVALDDEVGQQGCTVRHLMCHAGGYGFDSKDAIVRPERKRIYSNTGYEMLADHVASRVEMKFAEYLDLAIFEPLAMTASALLGSPAAHVHSTIGDVLAFALEMRRPQLIAASTYSSAISAQFSELEGVVPGLGRYDPCVWGLGPEIHGTKTPHWMGARNSSSTFGHFGGSGTFLWVDPVANIACVVLTDREFGEWAKISWPQFSDSVLAEIGR